MTIIQDIVTLQDTIAFALGVTNSFPKFNGVGIDCAATHFLIKGSADNGVAAISWAAAAGILGSKNYFSWRNLLAGAIFVCVAIKS